jgi:hypothetical protein
VKQTKRILSSSVSYISADEKRDATDAFSCAFNVLLCKCSTSCPSSMIAVMQERAEVVFDELGSMTAKVTFRTEESTGQLG